jgi:uroporphyrinogen-III decarboxylase
MTSRERLLAAMRFEKVDRVPVAPFGLGKLAPDSAMAAELIAATDPFITAGVPGDIIYGAGCEFDVRTEGAITTVVIKTPLGDLTQRTQVTPITSARIEFALKTREDLEKYLSIKYVEPEVDASAFHKEKAEIGEEGLVLASALDAVVLPADLLSPENFCLWWADYPELMLELTNLFAARLNDWISRLCKAGVDAFRIVGGEYASVQLGPAGFDALVVEQDKELIDIIHRHGGIAYYHNHGPVMRFLTRFREIGMDAIDPMEAPPWGDADLRQARAVCGDKVAFVGNLDDMEIMEKLPFDQIAPLAVERIEAAGDRGFILGGTASGTYTEKAARNFIALVGVAESLA